MASAPQRQCPYCAEPVTGPYCETHHAPTIDLSLLSLPSAPVGEGHVLAERYRIDAPIGEGFAGVVHRATQLAFGRQVAVKIVKSKTFHGARPLLRFFREAHSIGRLNHPNIVQVFDFGVDEATRSPYLVFELVEGRTLTEVIRSEGPLDARRAARLTAQTARALAEAHAIGIIHRDIKPNNLMVTRLVAGVELVKVLDFGLAKVLTDAPANAGALTAPGKLIGTPHFVSPEQAAGLAVDHRSDLYGLGCTLYACLSGRAPFAADSIHALIEAHRHQPPPPLPTDDPRLDALYQSLLAKDRDERPASAVIVAEMLEAIAADQPTDVTVRIPEAETEVPTRATVLVPVEEPEPSVTWPVAGLTEPDIERSAPVVLNSRQTPWLLIAAVPILGAAVWLLLATKPPAAVEEPPAKPAAQPAPIVAPRARPTVLVPLDSVPPGARVWVEGKQVGVTPMHVAVPGAKNQVDVEVEKDGYLHEVTTIARDAQPRLLRLQPKRRVREPPPPPKKEKPPEYPVW